MIYECMIYSIHKVFQVLLNIIHQIPVKTLNKLNSLQKKQYNDTQKNKAGHHTGKAELENIPTTKKKNKKPKKLNHYSKKN